MTRIVFTSDAHEQSGARRVDSFFGMEQIVSHAIKIKADAVVGAGDMMDKQRNRSAVATHMYRQITRLEKKGIPYLYLEGQHDADDPPWASAHPNAKLLHRELVVIGKYKLYGLSFQPFGVLQEELAKVPKCDVLVAHQGWTEWMGEETNPQGDFAQVTNAKMVVTGDYHKHVSAVVDNADGKKMKVFSPGCTYQKAINEPSQHGFWVLNDDGTMESVKLKSRPFIDSDIIRTTEEADAFVAKLPGLIRAAKKTAGAQELPEGIHTPLVRVNYSKRLGDIVRRVEKAANEEAMLFWKILPSDDDEDTADRASVIKTKKGETLTPMTALPKFLDKTKEPEVYGLLKATLDSPDKAKSFADWRTEFLRKE